MGGSLHALCLRTTYRTFQVLPRLDEVVGVLEKQRGEAHPDGDLDLGRLLARKRGKQTLDRLTVVALRFQDAGNVQEGCCGGVLGLHLANLMVADGRGVGQQ